LQRKTTLGHILWQGKEAEEEGRKSNINITNENWEKEEEGAKMLVEYVKNTGLDYGL
jgi:hypothetical protein